VLIESLVPVSPKVELFVAQSKTAWLGAVAAFLD
jgi:hypothetical protein